ncbi:hypothetical protein GY45DRAFT_1319993 [Cubamyces sp. BRFM 1775]|nr:hypothetical protein GY45DRAFT_1319993 [Cubamyces sp. BRFM 1775]
MTDVGTTADITHLHEIAKPMVRTHLHRPRLKTRRKKASEYRVHSHTLTPTESHKQGSLQNLPSTSQSTLSTTFATTS